MGDSHFLVPSVQQPLATESADADAILAQKRLIDDLEYENAMKVQRIAQPCSEDFGRQCAFVSKDMIEKLQRIICAYLKPAQNEQELIGQLVQLRTEKLVMAIFSARQIAKESEDAEQVFFNKLKDDSLLLNKYIRIAQLSLYKLYETIDQPSECNSSYTGEQSCVAAAQNSVVNEAIEKTQRIMHPVSPLSGSSKRAYIQRPPPVVLGSSLQSMYDIMSGARK